MSTYAESVRDLVKRIRGQQPGYGSDSILAELEHRYGYSQEALPGRSTLAAFLKQEKLVRSYEPHSDLPIKACQEPEAAHDLWQLDGRGNEQVSGIGTIALLDIKDVKSGVYINCLPARIKSRTGHPNSSDYQLAMRLAFMRHGLPGCLQVDHASVFHENTTKSPFPTRFHLWLVALGIDLCFSRVNRPTDQGKVEKAHQTLYDQVLKTTTPYKNWEQLYGKCQERCYYLNHYINSRACGNQPPVKACPQAEHSGRYYHPAREAVDLKMDRIYQYLAQGKWFRTVAGNNTIALGGQIYYIPQARPKDQLKITFCAHAKQFLFRDAKELLLAALPVKGLDQPYLMGQIGSIYHTPALQLPIPFDWEDQKVNTTFLDF